LGAAQPARERRITRSLLPVSAEFFSGVLKERGWYFSSFQASADNAYI